LCVHKSAFHRYFVKLSFKIINYDNDNFVFHSKLENATGYTINIDDISYATRDDGEDDLSK